MRFKGLTTLSNPSIFSARHSLRRLPSSPLGKPFLSNHNKYSSGRSIKTRPAYLPNGIVRVLISTGFLFLTWSCYSETTGRLEYHRNRRPNRRTHLIFDSEYARTQPQFGCLLCKRFESHHQHSYGFEDKRP